MLSSLVVGLTAGFILAIPPGPLAVAVMKKGLEGNVRAGMSVALGAVVMDSFYALIATFASSQIVTSLTGLVNTSDWFILAFQLVCILVLVALGIRYWKHRHVGTEPFEEREKKQEERAKQLGYSSPFFLGIIIALTNLAIPTMIPSLIGVVSFLHTNKLLAGPSINQVFFSLGFGLGTGLWLTVLVQTIYRHHKKISDDVLNGVFRFAGATFLFFALVMVGIVFASTEWNTLF